MTFSNSAYLDFAIQKLRPTAEFTFNDADYSTVNWIKLDGKAPTLSEVNAMIQKIKDDEVALEASRAADKAALLTRLGITAAEAKLLLS